MRFCQCAIHISRQEQYSTFMPEFKQKLFGGEFLNLKKKSNGKMFPVWEKGCAI